VVCLFQNSPTLSPLDCDDDEEIAPEETPQPFTLRDPEFLLNVISAEPKKIAHKELSDLIRDL
jgi:hypothetical protein